MLFMKKNINVMVKPAKKNDRWTPQLEAQIMFGLYPTKKEVK